MRKRLKLWNKWRKRNSNGLIFKLLVLVGIVHSPTFDLELTDEEWRRVSNSFGRSDIV